MLIKELLKLSESEDLELLAVFSKDFLKNAIIFMPAQNDWIEELKDDYGDNPHLVDVADMFSDVLKRYLAMSKLDKALLDKLTSKTEVDNTLKFTASEFLKSM